MASLQKKKHYQTSLMREEVKRYVDIIKRVVDVFITPWKEKKRDNNPMLTPKIAESIFANLEMIVRLEKTFIEEIDKVITSEAFDRIGAIIGHKSGYFKIYITYATNLRNALTVLFTQLEENSKFAAFVANGEKKLLKEFKHNMAALVPPPSSSARPVDFASILQGRFATSYLYHDLASLLLVPLHFLPRFHRLLSNLGSMLPPQDSDAPVIANLEKQSQMRLDTLTQEVENVRRVFDVQSMLSFAPNVVSSIDPKAYVDHRRIVKDGILKESRQGEVRLIYVIVFSDIILFTTKKEREEGDGHRFLVNRIELLSSIRAEDQEVGNDPNGFQIRLAEMVMILHASNPISKDEWLRSLRTSIQLAQAASPKDTNFSAEEDVINDFGSILKAMATNQITRLDLPEDCLHSNDSISFLSCLSANKSLTFLSLTGSQIGDTGMATISGWLQKTQTLKTLSLAKNRLSHLGMILLSDALRVNESVTSLDLSSNPIGTLGLGALVTGLIWNNSIVTLILSDTNLSPMSAPHLVLLFETNKCLQTIELYIRDNKSISDGTMSSAAWAINNSYGCIISNILTDTKFLEMVSHTLAYNKALPEREGKSPTKWNEEMYLPRPDALDMKQYGFVEVSEQLITKINSKQRNTRSLNSVVTLHLDRNSLISLNPDALIPLSENLRELTLHHNQLGTFPDLSMLTPNLTYLDLSENALSEFPRSLAHLRNLSHLNLGGNHISDLPLECIAILRGMKSLRQLLLHKNHFMQIPRAVFSLNHLTLFSVAGNPAIPVIKQKIYEAWASRVTMLDFSNLGLSYLPRDIEYLTSLVELIVRDNQLKELPPQIGRLPSLEVLDISRNQITVLPRQLIDAPKLKIVRLAGTPAASIMGDLLAGSDLQRRLAAQAHPAPARSARLKLLLVGKANVGKTSVFKALKSTKKSPAGISALLLKREGGGLHTLSPASMLFGGLNSSNSANQTQLSTDGIDMEEWTPLVSDGPQVSFNVFDFAGQDVYYATHQFFISPRSIFLVVFDMKKVFMANSNNANNSNNNNNNTSGSNDDEYASILYWLQCIEARGAACPVILVGTHVDEVSSDHAQLIQSQLRQMYFGKFPNVKDFVAVNAKTSKNVPNLLRLVTSLAQQDSSQQELVPASFFQLESLIVAERKQHTAYVTLGELGEWGRCCGVKSGEESLAVKWLHELGTVVHWGSGGHEDLVILDPNWLVRLLCTLVTTKANFVSNGILLRKNLDMIWKAPEFPSHLHEVLLSVLQKFELMYLLPDRVSFLIPNLLHNDRPKEVEIPNVYRLERNYFFTFMPFGLFARLMIRIIHFMDPKLYWRNGILATSQFTTTFLEFHPASLQLEVQVWGAKPARYLRFAMESIEVLARGWYAGVGCKVFVSCSCHACNPLPSLVSTAPSSRTSQSTTSATGDDVDESLFPNAFGTLRAFIRRQAQAIVAPKAMIPYSEFEDAILTNKLHLTCSNGGRVEIPYATPELTLTDISSLRINYNEIEFMDQIGKGGFGTVWRGKTRGQLVAVKKLGIGDPTLENHYDMINLLREFRREVWLSSTLSHKCVVSLLHFCISPCCIILEYLPHGNLHNYMKKVGEAGMSWEFRIKAAINIIDAIHCLHTQNPKILHRDLKSPNVLIATLDSRQDVVCKITDFGESRVIATSGAGRDNLANPVWLAPEVLSRSGEYTEKADIFSYGIILWELVTCQKPYDEYPVSKSSWVSKFEDEIVEGLRPTIPNDCPKEIKELIERCWNADPTKRPMSDEVLAILKDFQMFLPHMSLPQKAHTPKQGGSRLLGPVSPPSPSLPPSSPLPPSSSHSTSSKLNLAPLIVPSSHPNSPSSPSMRTTSPRSHSSASSSTSSPPFPSSLPSSPSSHRPPLLQARPAFSLLSPPSPSSPSSPPSSHHESTPPFQHPPPAPSTPSSPPLPPFSSSTTSIPASPPPPSSAQDKIERMRTIITRVLERTIEYLSGIQINIEAAETIVELNQLGNGAKLLYLGAKKLETFRARDPKAKNSDESGSASASMSSLSLSTPPSRFNSTVINNTTINNTNINITINSPTSPDLISDAITNAINDVINSSLSSSSSSDPSSSSSSSPIEDKLTMLKKRLSSVNKDACDIMKKVLMMVSDTSTDQSTLMEMAKLVMSMKQTSN